MIFCDIHTHQPPANPEDLAVIAADIRQPFPLRSGRYAVGIHPWHADKAALPLLRTLATHPQVAAIGEAGLDKLASTSLSFQEEVFTAQARLAGEVGKPLIIHCVKAWPELIAIRQTVRSDIPWIIHGFRGNDKLAGQLLCFGFYLSFGIHFQSEAVRMAWKAHRLFAETDNENVDIREVYSSIAARLSISEETLSQAILENLRMVQLYPHSIKDKAGLIP